MKPPEQIPPEFIEQYTMANKIKIEYWYFDETSSSDKPLIYSRDTIDQYIEEIKQGRLFYYGKMDRCLYQALKKYSISGMQVAIMGSQTPLYESICLAYGGHPKTIEYNRLISEDPRLEVMTPAEYDESPVLFDAGFSISSFEHDGLGRYGDPLNPEGDLLAMKKMKSMIKTNGLLFLSVPVGRDILVWNAHRIYGIRRLPLLLKGWRLLDVKWASLDRPSWEYQPVFILENSDTEGKNVRWVWMQMMLFMPLQFFMRSLRFGIKKVLRKAIRFMIGEASFIRLKKSIYKKGDLN
ncbi:MAG: DUF268 domain-containing protein [Candidatus Omnitrophica bacterium]|nr:DUF268 domain-containing protein [Candidatus Omnitrophota bacterium]